MYINDFLNYKGLLDDKVTQTSAIDDNVTSYGGQLLASTKYLGMLYKTKNLFLHFYFDRKDSSYSEYLQLFYSYYESIRTKEDINGYRVWDDLGIDVTVRINDDYSIDNFKKSLMVPGAIVVYLGHGMRNEKKKETVGLAFSDGDIFLSNKDLWNMIDISCASILLLCGCDTLGCFKGNKIKNKRIAVVATESNPDTLTTEYDECFKPIKSFLYTLIYCEDIFDPIELKNDAGIYLPDYQKDLIKEMNTVNFAIKTANKVFLQDSVGCKKDSFILVSGDGETRII